MGFVFRVSGFPIERETRDVRPETAFLGAVQIIDEAAVIDAP
jgi:hypothetical protein